MIDDEKYDLKKYLDPTFALLDKFREVAPGSFKHCQNVSNICESVAVELSLDVDLMKCAALYHDIGKINNPLFFSENQTDEENVHDKLEPILSYHTITRHVGDSVLYMLQCEGIPHKVIEIISQHHGDTVLRAFHNKAKTEPEDKYRYKCKKPTSTEAAVLMIVDSVEATARALYNNDPKSENDIISKALNGTIDRLIDDSQLDNVTLGTLKVIKKLLRVELSSIYHKRVTYDDEEDEKTIGETKP